MSSAKLTTIGVYNYLKELNDDLFIQLSIPSELDKETLIDNILLRGGEFEVLYSDPYFMQSAIGAWSDKWSRTMNKWVEALNIEYNPLENYDRMEDWTDHNTGTVTDTGTVKDTGTVGTETHTETDTTTDNKVSAFNSDTMRDNDSSAGSADSDSTGTTTNDLTKTNNLTRTDNLTMTRTGRAHGNIGVTTSQQMLQSELDIVAWNIYEHITDLFLQEFVIPVY